MMPICYLFLFLRAVLWEILNTFQRLCGNSQTPMIIIRPDLVIKRANSNLVLHRVRERLFMLLCVSVYPYISKYTRPCEVEFALLFICASVRRKVPQRKSICPGNFAQAWRLFSSLFWLKKGKQKHKHSPIHSLSSSLFSILHSSLFLYRLQRHPFPPK